MPLVRIDLVSKIGVLLYSLDCEASVLGRWWHWLDDFLFATDFDEDQRQPAISRGEELGLGSMNEEQTLVSLHRAKQLNELAYAL